MVRKNNKKIEKNKKILLTKTRNNVNIIDVNVTRTLATEQRKDKKATIKFGVK